MHAVMFCSVSYVYVWVLPFRASDKCSTVNQQFHTAWRMARSLFIDWLLKQQCHPFLSCTKLI